MNGWGRIVKAFYVLVVGSLNGVFAALIATLGAKEGAEGNILRDIWQLYGSGEDVTWMFWGWCLLLVGGPLVLLFVRIDLSDLRVRPRCLWRSPPSRQGS